VKPKSAEFTGDYLLRKLPVTRPNRVCAMDITCIPLSADCCAIACRAMDVARLHLSGRRPGLVNAQGPVLAGVNHLGSGLLHRSHRGSPGPSWKAEIFNTDQGSQFTSTGFIKVLAGREIKISMDGKGAWRDNVFVERLWRTIKYGEVCLQACASVLEARARLGATSASTEGGAHIHRLTAKPPIRLASTR
jgi:putative transposase